VFAGWKEQTSDDFRRYLYEMMKRELGRATIRLHFAALRSFFKIPDAAQGLEAQPVARCATAETGEEAARGAVGEAGDRE